MDFEIIPPITDSETFAEGGAIREIRRLRRAYGGRNWRKRKGFCNVKIDNDILFAEVHWYECHGVGAREYKIKRFITLN